MTVGDLSKYLSALADVIGSAKGVGKDVEAAAKALAPFANHKMEAFATFLQLAEAKYRETGELPDGKEPKSKRVAKVKVEKVPKPTVAAFADRINELMAMLDRGEPLDRATVTAEVNKFEPVPQKDIDALMVNDLKFPAKVKGKEKSLEAIVGHILAERTAADRNKV